MKNPNGGIHSELKLVIDKEQPDKANADTDDFVPRQRFLVQQEADKDQDDRKRNAPMFAPCRNSETI